jgi:hypothetical protein
MSSSIESELSSLLTDLLDRQGQLLEILGRKQQLLGAADSDGMTAITAEEGRLVDGLQECLQRREQLLARARGEGMPAESIRALAAALPPAERKPIRRQVELAGARARLLQHQSLTNWVIIQRTLIHLSQLLEIIATGGTLQPTYGGGQNSQRGSLVDRAA